jgi:glycosyltransferase involved in cell wall biosynthesis
MKRELLEDFRVREPHITVLRHPINNVFPDTDLTPAEAKKRLGIRNGERTLLFFGNIRPYKGLEYLVEAFQQLAAKHSDYRLIIAGEGKRGSEKYLKEVQQLIARDSSQIRIIQKIHFIPDEETELYFKAADVLILPYKAIFQSGVLFLAYNFGLPVVATDVGAFRDEIVEGRMGFLCNPCDSSALAKTIERYFESDLYKQLNGYRKEIKDYAHARHSWQAVGQVTRDVYSGLLERSLSS